MFFKRVIVFIIVFSIGAVIARQFNPVPSDSLLPPLLFWGVVLSLWMFYYAYLESAKGKIIKMLHPLIQNGIGLVYILTAVAISLFVVVLFTGNGMESLYNIPMSTYVLVSIFSVLISTMVTVTLRAINIIGARHFIPFMVGTYHRPVEKQRIVMFIDMVGSSAMAERLAPIDAQSLIAKFIFDLSGVLRRNKGDIVNFMGDGLVILWNINQTSSVLTAIEAMYAEIEKEKKNYLEQFDFVPEFRVGVHAGTVIISQIGEEKLFFGLYGDVVNTAARLEAKNKELNSKVLISKDVLADASLANDPRFCPRGEQDIRGRKGKIEIFEMLTEKS